MRFYAAGNTPDTEGGIFLCEIPEVIGEENLIKHFHFPMERVNFLTYGKDRKHLYATCSVNDEPSVASFAVKPDGSLELLSTLPSGGAAPCFLTVDAEEKFLYCANYMAGNFTVFELENGVIKNRVATVQHEGCGPNLPRQDKAHVHYIEFTPDKKYLAVVDLGIDEVRSYAYDPVKGICTTPHAVYHGTPGRGPRHLAFTADSTMAYLLNELGNTVVSLKYADGVFTFIEEKSTLPPAFRGFTKASAIRLSKDENFLFASNRGFDSFAVYSLDGEGGMALKDFVLSGGTSPRDIQLLGNDTVMGTANEGGNICFFDYDGKGKCTPNGISAALPGALYFLEA